MELAGLIVTIVLGLIGICVAWWVPTETRIRQSLRDAESRLSFGMGSYGGPDGQGLVLNLENKDNAAAYNLSLYLPGINGPAWHIDELPAHKALYNIQIPLAVDAPMRTDQKDGLIARLVYYDRLEREFVASLDLIQKSRADGFYNIESSTSKPKITGPDIRFLDLWRLRKRV